MSTATRRNNGQWRTRNSGPLKAQETLIHVGHDEMELHLDVSLEIFQVYPQFTFSVDQGWKWRTIVEVEEHRVKISGPFSQSLISAISLHPDPPYGHLEKTCPCETHVSGTQSKVHWIHGVKTWTYLIVEEEGHVNDEQSQDDEDHPDDQMNHRI